MKNTVTSPVLPKGVLQSDLTVPTFKTRQNYVDSYQDYSVELWYVESGRRDGDGWYIPTLQISRSRNGYADRSYAVRVSDGSTGWRIGRGPHVKQQIIVYIKKSRAEKLQFLLDLRNKGAESAGQIRDRISSRRAQGQLMRAEGRRSWTWAR